MLATLVDSALVFYDRYVESLSESERDAYWQDYRVVGGLFGLQDDEMPADIRAFDAYMRGMLEGDDLFVASAARELALQIVMRPPVPLAKRPILEVVNFITVGLLPARLRRQFGLTWDRCARSCCAAVRSTPSACSCRWRRAGCGSCPARASRSRDYAALIAEMSSSASDTSATYAKCAAVERDVELHAELGGRPRGRRPEADALRCRRGRSPIPPSTPNSTYLVATHHHRIRRPP